MIDIFMLSSHPLFMEGVVSLLKENTELRLVGRECEVERALEQIRAVHPDIVLVDTGDSECNASSVVMRILQVNQNVKIIGLNLVNNTICIYHEEQRLVHGVEDLMRAVIPNDPALAN